MLNWNIAIPEEDKLFIERIIQPDVLNAILDSDTDTLLEEFGVEWTDEGGFSDIIFYKDYAMKYTSCWDIDFDLDSIYLGVPLCVNSDAEVVNSLSGSVPFLPKIYAQSNEWVIMERMKGPNLYDLYVDSKKSDIPAELKSNLLLFIEKCLVAGWHPLDLRMRCIYPNEESGLKIIDFNLYQKVSYLLEENSKLDLTKDLSILAKEILEHEMFAFPS